VDKVSSPSKETKDGSTVFGFDGTALEEEEDEEEESDSKAADEAMERYKVWFGLNAASTTLQIVDELRAIQTMSSLRPADRIIIFLGAVFTEDFITANEVKAHRPILAALAPSSIQHRHMIAAVEWLCGTKFPSLVKFFPVVLKQLLDEELVDEEAFYAWHEDLTRNEYSAEQSMMCLDTLEHLKESAAPFITWLEEAEEEEDDEED
jgi:translation initiation factor 5